MYSSSLCAGTTAMTRGNGRSMYPSTLVPLSRSPPRLPRRDAWASEHSRCNPLTSRSGLCNGFDCYDTERWQFCFNPLLRGAASATGRPDPIEEAVDRVSIPYFAGRPLQLLDGGLEGLIINGFQSPTSRGGLCNTEAEGVVGQPLRHVSIPYFAGRPLQLGGTRLGRNHRLAGFNPLLRGATAATRE